MSGLPNNAYWVEEGQFMAGPYPGELEEAAAIRSLNALCESGVTHFIDLTFPKGQSSDMLEPYEHLLSDLRSGSTGYSRFSIVDLDVPTVELMTEILSEIDDLTSRGEVVYVHCWGGVGRTGTVVACHLINSGLSADQAFEKIADFRQGLANGYKTSPEMPGQEDFVRTWSDASSARE